MESQSQLAAENPFGYGYLLNVIYTSFQKPIEITILNKSDKEILKFLTESFIPESIMVFISNQSQIDILSKYPFFEGKKFDLKTKVFICRHFACSLPLHSVDEIKNELAKFNS